MRFQEIGDERNQIVTTGRGVAMTSLDPQQADQLIDPGPDNPRGIIINTLVVASGGSTNNGIYGVLLIDGVAVWSTKHSLWTGSCAVDHLEHPILVKPGIEVKIATYFTSNVEISWTKL